MAIISRSFFQPRNLLIYAHDVAMAYAAFLAAFVLRLGFEALAQPGVFGMAAVFAAAGAAVLVFLAGHHGFGQGAVGETALRIAHAKMTLGFAEAFFLGILCNILVCLAVWLSYSAHTVTGKVLVIVPPVAAFVAAGFEHSIANMYLIPAGLLIKWFAEPSFWQLISATPQQFSSLTLDEILTTIAPSGGR